MSDGAPPEVAVVIPTVDRVALLDRCLEGVAEQTGVDFEVVVAHDGDAGILELLDRWRSRLNLVPVAAEGRDASTKRNAGWHATKAELIAFVDDDCQPTAGWLRVAVAAAADPGVDLVQGPVQPHPADAGVGGVFARTLDVAEPTDTYPNANLLYRRSALERVGGFDPAIWGGGEDTDLAWRVIESGGRVEWAPAALVYHAVRPANLAQHLRSLPRWSTLALTLRGHPQLRRLLHRKLFWKRSHPAALVALIGLFLALFDRRALSLCLPVLIRRTRQAGLTDGVQLAIADVTEVVVMVVGSVRYRAVIL